MANLRAIGFDGETIIYLLADGTGTDSDPFVSSFKLVDQNLLATESGLTAIANLIPEFTFDGSRLTVKTELQQPLTLTELESVTVKVSEQTPLNISELAKESKQDDLIAKLPSGLTVTGGKLLVDAGVNLPVSYPVTGDFYPATQPVSFGSLPTGTNTIGSIANTTFGATQSGSWTVGINNFPTTQTVTGTVNANTGLDPLTDSQLRATPVNVNQSSLPGLRIPDHDEITLGYTGENLTTVIYKLSNVVVATLTLSYTNDNLTSVVRS